MKIYTKKGDDGTTGLIGGTRVNKFDLRIECYGTVDELNANIGMLNDLQEDESIKKELKSIQDLLFNVGSILAADPEKNKMELPGVEKTHVEFLEQKMDEMTGELPELKHFILPGGHIAVSAAHIARCVCRRAERLVVHLSKKDKVDPIILQYLNRLSDYLFVLGRKIAQNLKITEIKWNPSK